MAIGKKKRFEVFKRDLFVCQYCGRTPPAVVLEVDHIVATSSGGDDHPSNLTTSCFDCNRGKGAGSLDNIPAPIAEQQAQRKEAYEQAKAFNDFLMGVRADVDAAIERLGIHWCNKFKKEKGRWIFGEDQRASVRVFLEKLPEATIFDAIDLAHARVPVRGDGAQKTWKYFCGICWNKIKGDTGRRL